MGNEFKDFEMETPSLTLEPDLGEFAKKEEVIPKEQPQKEEEAPAEEHCCCEKPEQTPAEPEDTAIEIHIAGQKDGSAE